MVWLAWKTWGAKPEIVTEALDKPATLKKGIAVNLLSPHPYLFWFSVGVPLMIKAASHNKLQPVVFASAFFACLCGAKVVIVGLTAKGRRFLQGRAYQNTLRVLSLCLLGFALAMIYDGAVRLQG